MLLTGKSGLRDGAPLFDVGAEWHGTSDMTGGDFLLPAADLRAADVHDPLFM